MIYTLETIPLSKFIEVFNGNIENAGENEYKDKLCVAAETMVSEYMQIVGNKSAKNELARLNDELNSKIKLNLMDVCDNLIELKEWESVSAILRSLGYSLLEESKMKQRVSSIRASLNLKEQMRSKKEDHSDIDKDYFIKERAMLMSHYKMHIDPGIYKAKEYAYLVRNFITEIKSLSKNKR